MKNRVIAPITILVATTIMIAISCSKSNSDGGSNPGGTQTDSALVNIGAQVIVPSFQAFATATTALDQAISAFTQAPGASTLDAAQAACKTAYLAWESCSEYSFGPAADQSLVTNTINVFPTDSSIIKTNISSGSYTIDGISNLKAQGFPAIDFLLYSGGNANVLARFTTDANATNAKKYLSAITSSIKSKATATSTAWGNYLATFKAATGVDAGSSLSLLINAFVMDYDVVLKTYKLGIPIGKFGVTSIPMSPEKTEAYYSGISLQLMIQQVKAIQNLYLGGNGYGLDDKVIASKAQKNGVPLDDVINGEFTAVLAKLNALQDPLSSAILNNLSAVNDAYTEATKLVVLIKVDLSSALAVKISFQDADGD